MERSIAAAGWRFDNSYVRLPAPLFSREKPTPVRAAGLATFNDPLAAELGLDAEVLRADRGAVVAGNTLPPGADPIAQAYAGHQFGHFTNLGDGRALLLGEQLTPDGRRVDVQLKGSGRTRYSRGGDGRAALGPMLREYVVSEAMNALGIPTTRSLAVASTGETVLRERPLPGAVLARVAASHIRVGTFQYARALGDRELLEALLAHAINRHDPDLAAGGGDAVDFFAVVLERQAELVARWMLVGFVHGVMNTDNMAVSGETIDYGPCAFLDGYDPATVFSSIDTGGRYAYANQPAIAQWNLARLAECLLPLVPGDAEAVLARMQDVLGRFPERYERHFLAGARAKLGLVTAEPGDVDLVAGLLRRMHEARADFTTTFAGLAGLVGGEATAATTPPHGAHSGAAATAAVLGDWLAEWRSRLEREPGPGSDVVGRLQRANPVVIPRNHRVEEAIAAAESGDMTGFERLVRAVREPFTASPDNEPYRGGPPPGCGPYRTFCGT